MKKNIYAFIAISIWSSIQHNTIYPMEMAEYSFQGNNSVSSLLYILENHQFQQNDQKDLALLMDVFTYLTNAKNIPQLEKILTLAARHTPRVVLDQKIIFIISSIDLTNKDTLTEQQKAAELLLNTSIEKAVNALKENNEAIIKALKALEEVNHIKSKISAEYFQPKNVLKRSEFKNALDETTMLMHRAKELNNKGHSKNTSFINNYEEANRKLLKPSNQSSAITKMSATAQESTMLYEKLFLLINQLP